MQLILEDVQVEGGRVTGSLVLLLEDLLFELGDLGENLDKYFLEVAHIDVASLIALCEPLQTRPERLPFLSWLIC